jgi:prepilin-type N-terminal cleavage/methylation domain-containing protein
MKSDIRQPKPGSDPGRPRGHAWAAAFPSFSSFSSVKPAFTLIELLVVIAIIAIIGILASLRLPVLRRSGGAPQRRGLDALRRNPVLFPRLFLCTER